MGGIFAVLVVALVFCAFSIEKNIEITVNPRTAQSQAQTQSATVPLAATVGQILSQEGIDADDTYAVSADLNAPAFSVDNITVTKKAAGVLTADGQVIEYNTDAATVGDVLAENNITLDSDDEVSPAADTAMTTDVKIIKVSRVETKLESTQQAVAYSQNVQENADLDATVQNVVSAGQNGLETVVDQVVYKDGIAVGRSTVAKATTLQPVVEVVEKGTKSSSSASTTSGNATATPGSDFDLICAVVQQEGGGSYESALAVISCIMNRVDRGGGDAVSVITAPGQFSAYLDGAYEKYLGNSSADVQQAVKDCMEGGKRNHSCTSFRGYYVEGSTQIGGNYYF